mmetsp:Transcript_67472/g.206656  ORF Transcript_67472/g.206656 Transcript_67472/m.206656 type:complete len:351 (+) Transcript_67472:175-1227(+)
MRCIVIPSASSGLRFTRNRRSSSLSVSPSGSSTVIFSSAEFVALPGTSKKLFIVSGRQWNSVTKLTVSESLISPSSSHMTPAASASPRASKRSGSPQMYSPVHFVASFTLADRHARAYLLMLAIGSSACSQHRPSAVCSPRAAPAGSPAAAVEKKAKPSGEQIASRMVAEACDTLTRSSVQRPRKAPCNRPLRQSASNLAPRLAPAPGGGRSLAATGCSTGKKRASMAFRSSFLPMKTILLMRGSCSPQSGPSDVSVTSATAWNTSFAGRPAAARTPLDRYSLPCSSGRVAMMRIHRAKASWSTSMPGFTMLKLPISLSCRDLWAWPWPKPPPWPPPWPWSPSRVMSWPA